MRLRAALALAVALATSAATASAQPSLSDPIESARQALDEGEFAKAAELAARALSGQLSDERLAAAWRIRGLALFYAGRKAEAGPAFLAYLKLDTEARLDPAFHTPEAVSFFESVRSDNAAELAKYKREPEQRRFIVNLLPPFGQFQNKQPTKAWIIAGLEVGLLAANLTAFGLHARWCGGDGTCGDRNDDARTARIVAIATGWTLVAVIGYGIIDGVAGYRRWQNSRPTTLETMSVGIAPTGENGWSAIAGFRF